MIDKHGTVYVDNTTLSAVASCDSKATLRHVLGYTIAGEEAHVLESGTIAHEVLAMHLQGKSADECLLHYQARYQPYSHEHRLDDYDDNPHYRLSYTNTNKILTEYLETHPLPSYSFSVNPKLVEVGFALPLSDECVCEHLESAHKSGYGCTYDRWDYGCSCAEFKPAFVFWGRLDAIVQGKHDSSLYVLDHKTTGRLTPYWTEKFRNDSQMTGYVWAAQQTLGQPVVGVFINAIEFSKLPDHPTRKCTKHGVVYAECGIHHTNAQMLIYTRSPDQLVEWQATALELAERYRALHHAAPNIESLHKIRTQGTFTGACGFCPFQTFCAAGRPLHYVPTMLVQRPWRPFLLEEEKST